MKNIICFLILFGIILALSPLHGCGGGEDEATKALTAPEDTQTVVEQEVDLSAENSGTASQITEPLSVSETRPIDQEIKPDLPSGGDKTISQTTESVEVTEKTSTMQEIVDVITIENQGYTSDKKGPVKFSHLKHNKEYDIDCVQCHHLYQDGENIWKEGDKVDKCVVCHDPVEDKDKAIKLQSAFHKNCRDCHSEANKEGKEAPSIKCTECHG